MKLRRIVSLILAIAILAAVSAIPAMADDTKVLRTTASVNIRKGPGTNYGKITAVSVNKTFTYTGTSAYSKGGTLWHKIAYKKSVAWVSSVYSYVTIDGEKLNNSVYVESTASVNLRKGPNADYKILTSVANKTKLFYLGDKETDSNGRVWYKVACSKGTAWVTSKYSRLSTDPVKVDYVITTASVNLRKGAGTKYGKITAFAKGVTLVYLGKTKTDSRGVRWYYASYKNYKGWISSKYSKILMAF